MTTHTTFITNWGLAAQRKLKADGVDPDDLVAVEKCLTACVGGQRFLQAWVDWRKAQRVQCQICHGHGYIIDIWHRKHPCQACDSEGSMTQ